jgi:hypothetical protein
VGRNKPLILIWPGLVQPLAGARVLQRPANPFRTYDLSNLIVWDFLCLIIQKTEKVVDFSINRKLTIIGLIFGNRSLKYGHSLN